MGVKNGKMIYLWAGIVVLILTGCDKSSNSARNPGEVTIKVSTWDAENSYTLNLREAFAKAYPGIKLEIIDIPAADYTQKLSVMLNGGSDVDSFWIKDGDTTKGLSNRGQLADLSAYVQRDNIRLADYNGLAERFNIDGKLVALPASTGYYVLYYNKDIFDKAKAPYPSNDMTWSEWEALAIRLSSGSGNNKIWGALLHTWPACVQNWCFQDGKNTIMATDYRFFKPYYEMALRMQDAGTLWDYGSLRTGGIHYSSAFLQGNVATLPMGTWFFYTILDRIKAGETKINFGIATLPHPPGVPAGWTVGSVTPIAINQASKNKDAAWEFVKFVTSEEGARIHAEGGGIPSRSNSKVLQALAGIPGMPEGSLAALEVKNIALDRPMEDFVAEVNQMLSEEHSLIMLKEVSIDQGLANMAKRSKEIQGK
jgi:multiple sugar transport system substrate-binding protein